MTEKKWKYQVVALPFLNNQYEEWLNEHGKDGFELCSIIPDYCGKEGEFAAVLKKSYYDE